MSIYTNYKYNKYSTHPHIHCILAVPLPLDVRGEKVTALHRHLSNLGASYSLCLRVFN